MKQLLVGGASTPPAILQWLVECWGAAMVPGGSTGAGEGYGMTETGAIADAERGKAGLKFRTGVTWKLERRERQLFVEQRKVARAIRARTARSHT